MKPRLRISLRTKVLAVVLFSVAVPVLGMGFFLLQRHEEVLREKVRENLSFHLLRRTAQVEGWASDRMRELGRWSTSFVLFEGIGGLSATGTGPERARRDVHEFLLSLQRYNGVWESLFVADRSGRILAGTREEELEPWARALVVSPTPPVEAFSPLLDSQRLRRPTLLAFHTIQDQKAETVGFLVGRIAVADLEAQLEPPPTDRAVSFWLLDDARHVLARAGKLVPPAARGAFPYRIASRWDEVRTVDPRDLPGLSGTALWAARPLERPLSGYAVATIPISVAYRTLHDSRTRVLAYGLPFLLVVFALTLFETRQLLLPIRRLSEGAQRLSGGDLEVQLPERGRDEIGDLTRVFNEMARRVRDGRQRLEEARDALARSNEELTGANRILGRLAITDGLTGLYNHRHFQDTLKRELHLADREGHPLALLMIDLDFFKSYNDRWGHTSGDAALRSVAHTLKESLRSSDLAFRYGGEELAAILPGCDKARGVEVAEKLRVAVKAIVPSEGQTGALLTVSIGVAAAPEDAAEARELLDLADTALYAAKRRGRDQVVAAARPEVPELVPGT